MICVRLVEREDADVLVDLAEANQRECAPHLETDRARVRWTVLQSVRKAHPTIFVAEMDGEIVGYLLCTINGYNFMAGIFVQQDVVYVRPDKRGSRAAVKMIQQFIEWGRTVGAREYFVGTSTGFKPERTARLFEHLGATRVGHSLKGIY